MADEVRIKISSDSSDVRRELKRTEGAIEGFASRTRSSFRGLQASIAALGVGVAIRGIVDFTKESVRLYAEQEKQQRRLEAVLRATGNAAGFSAKQLESHAKALERTTLFSQEMITAGQSVLLTFKSIQGNVFRETTELALDMASVVGGDVTSAMTMLGKALEDPIRGLTALRRVGATFTEEQEELIKSLAESGRIADAQIEILRVLKGQYEGASDVTDTFAGKVKQLNDAWVQLRKDLGQAVVEGLDPAFEALEDTQVKIDWEWLTEKIESYSTAFANLNRTASETNGPLEAILNVVTHMADPVQDVADSFNNLWKAAEAYQNSINREGGFIIVDTEKLDEEVAAVIEAQEKMGVHGFRPQSAPGSGITPEQAEAAAERAATQEQQMLDQRFMLMQRVWELEDEQNAKNLEAAREEAELLRAAEEERFDLRMRLLDQLKTPEDRFVDRMMEWVDAFNAGVVSLEEITARFDMERKKLEEVIADEAPREERDRGFRASITSLEGAYRKMLTAGASRDPAQAIDEASKKRSEEAGRMIDKLDELKGFMAVGP